MLDESVFDVVHRVFYGRALTVVDLGGVSSVHILQDKSEPNAVRFNPTKNGTRRLNHLERIAAVTRYLKQHEQSMLYAERKQVGLSFNQTKLAVRDMTERGLIEFEAVGWRRIYKLTDKGRG